MMSHCFISLVELRGSALSVLPWNPEPDLDVLFLLTITAVSLRGLIAEKASASGNRLSLSGCRNRLVTEFFPRQVCVCVCVCQRERGKERKREQIHIH